MGENLVNSLTFFHLRDLISKYGYSSALRADFSFGIYVKNKM